MLLDGDIQNIARAYFVVPMRSIPSSRVIQHLEAGNILLIEGEIIIWY